MTEAIVPLILAQWGVLLVLGIGLVALARQIGVLHQRLGPAGALMLSKAAKVGEPAPQFRLAGLDGGEVAIGGAATDGRDTLLMFISPDCKVCGGLLPTILSLGRAERLRLVFASDGDAAAHLRFQRDKGLAAHPYVISRDLGLAFEIGRLPYAVLIDAHGVVAAQGLVNTREHLESLVEARRLGVASIQDFLANTPADAPVPTFKIAKR